MVLVVDAGSGGTDRLGSSPIVVVDIGGDDADRVKGEELARPTVVVVIGGESGPRLIVVVVTLVGVDGDEVL